MKKPMSTLASQFAEQTAERRAIALRRALQALTDLDRAGIRAWVIGSLAHDRFHANSDVDITIECEAAREKEAFAIIERAMRGFPFHMVPGRRIKEDTLAFMMEGALDASGLCSRSPTTT
jgi:predicted nucleotidyltransferase